MTQREIKLLAKEIVAEQMRYEVIGIDEVACMLGVSPSYIYHNIEQIPHEKPFGKLRFFRSDIVKLIKRA